MRAFALALALAVVTNIDKRGGTDCHQTHQTSQPQHDNTLTNLQNGTVPRADTSHIAAFASKGKALTG
ncbi:hypothetical protein GCM10007927_34690 [Sulfitobacter pacificus]|uniref:Uncharacterized protein n=1 Tax=Sulfitobacter pacificus TaxID=1499314 RepID=A0ABQ5VNM0_9RHOB|nr:hypothetical protein GCM10007927_34690 [Sulfitobacter pacificus]